MLILVDAVHSSVVCAKRSRFCFCGWYCASTSRAAQDDKGPITGQRAVCFLVPTCACCAVGQVEGSVVPQAVRVLAPLSALDVCCVLENQLCGVVFTGVKTWLFALIR